LVASELGRLEFLGGSKGKYMQVRGGGSNGSFRNGISKAMDRQVREVVDSFFFFSPKRCPKTPSPFFDWGEVNWCMYVGEVRRFPTTRPFIRSFIQSFIEFFFFFFFFHCLYVCVLILVNWFSASVLALLSSLSLPGYINRINSKLELRANDWE
jgi:hypothetical protein